MALSALLTLRSAVAQFVEVVVGCVCGLVVVQWPWVSGAVGCGSWVVSVERHLRWPTEQSSCWFFFFLISGYEMEICGWVRCVAGVGFVFMLSGGFVFLDHLSCVDLLCGSEIVSRFGFMVVL
jgi:hypothetical protein